MIEKFLDKRKLILTFLFFFILFGLQKYVSLPKESDPDISIPVIYVSIAHKGISPDDSERLIIKPMEKELKNIEGVKKVSSNSFNGGGNIILEFDAGFNASKALSDTRVKIDITKNKLPDDTEEPIATEVNLSRFPVLAVAVSGNIEERIINKYAKELKNKIESISEILEVQTLGAREREIEIIVNPKMVKNYGLTDSDVLLSITNSNIMIPAGAITNEKGSFNVTIPSLIEKKTDLLNLPIKSNSNSVVFLRDVAEIRDSFKERKGYARNNGKNAVILEVSKRTGENIIETINKIKDLIEFEKVNIPDYLEVSFFQDESDKIKSQIADLENNVILASLIVLMIIVIFMGWKSGLLVSVSIPASFLCSMIILSFFNVTINVVVLFSLILSVGILIDGAIIVVEYANRRANEGISKENVFKLSAKQMFIPVLASTLTTLAAFFPLIFWPGIAGEFMFFLPVTLLAVLGSSLVVALIFIPTLGSIFGNDINTSNQSLNTLNLLEKGNLDKIKGLQGKYIKLMRYCLENPKKLITLTFVFLVFVQLLYSKLGKGFEFFPPIEPDYAEIVIHARGNLSADEKDLIVKKVEDEVLKNNYIRNIYSRSGEIKGNKKSESDDVIGSIKIEFSDWKIRPKSNEIISSLKKVTNKFAGIYIEFIEKKDGPPKDKDIEIEIINFNNKQLINETALLYKYIKDQDWAKNIDSDVLTTGIEWELKIDREKADKYGVNLLSIGNSIQMITHGLKVSEFMPIDSDEEVDIVVKYDKKFRTLDELDNILIDGENGPISMSMFVERIPKKRVNKITRSNSTRSKNIKFDVTKNTVSSNKILQIKSWLQTNNLSSQVIFRGQEEDQNEAKEFLTKAFFIAVFLITIILIAVFNSYYYCLIILSAIIFSTIGVMIGLIISNQPFGIIMSGIGVIALAGIVVNNNIVLLDTYKQLRKSGENIKDCIIRTGAQRLRPVLLTTLTTFFGLVPMAIGLNIDFINMEVNFGSPTSQWWTQLSNAMVFGVMFSFILTLIITPCLIYIGEKSRFLKLF